ncbi:putative AC transposase [Bienertia sinuspersici]
MMEPVLCPDTLEVNIDWGRTARRGAAVADKLNYTEYGLRKKVIALDTPTRWNSTYKLLHDAIAYRDVLTNMYNESQATDGQFIINDYWSLAKIVHDVLETFDNATHIFSYVYEPNIHTVILECIKIICTIKQTSQANPGAAVKRLLDNMKVKWCAYFTEFPPTYAIAAILDPSVKLEGFRPISGGRRLGGRLIEWKEAKLVRGLEQTTPRRRLGAPQYHFSGRQLSERLRSAGER